MLRSWRKPRTKALTSRPRLTRGQRARLNLESLENRTLPSTIVWTNRGSAYSDTDSFNAVFGGNASLARAVVDSALLAWQNVIASFNYADGTNTLSLTISVNPASHGNGALAWAGTQTDFHGKPKAGAIQIDSGSDGHGAGFYLDPNIFSAAYLGSMDNPYVRAATSGSPAAYSGDLFSLLNHEILHTLGLSNNPGLLFAQSPYLQSTGVPDAVDRPGTLFTFTGPDVQALLTSDDGDSVDTGRAEHTARPGNAYTNPVTHVTYTAVYDAVNPLYFYGRRYLPSLMDALILRDAYGYAVNTPPAYSTGSPTNFFATGASAGSPGIVNVYDGTTGALRFSFYAYDPSFTGGVHVAVGSVYGNGSLQIVTSPGMGAAPDIRVFDGATGTLLREFYAYDPGCTVGVSVAVGDVEGDGFADIVTGTTAGNPDVRVFSGKALAQGTFNPNGAALLAQWFPYAIQYNVGANVAVGDIEHDGYADIVTGATAGNPDVRVYSGRDIANHTFDPNASMLAQWFPYAIQYNVGANVAVGDVNGDGYADVVTGATVGNPDVRVYDGWAIATRTFSRANPDANRLAQFFAYGLQYNVGAFVSVADLGDDGFGDVITGASTGSPHVKVYSGRAIATGTFNSAAPDASCVQQFFAYSQATGVTVGGYC